jgi:hypothetical protein
LKKEIGVHASGSMYTLGCCDWTYKTVSDVIYLPKTQHCENLPPIFVVVQSIIDSTFMEKLIKYSLSLYEEYQTLPILLIISVEGYSNEEIKSKFKSNEDAFLMEANCQFWANRCYIISSESILGFIDERPLDKLVALACCFIDIDNSSHSDDPTIKSFFDLVNE